MIGWLLAAVLQTAGAATATEADMPTALVAVEDNVIRYEGEINPEGTERFLDVLDGAPDVTVLAVNSAGGSIEHAMRMGEAIHVRGLDVRVEQQCVSSCANYLFPAGRHKIIAGDALVIWHGSAIQAGLWDVDVSAVTGPDGEPIGWWQRRQLKREMREYGQRMQREQRALYDRLGVDEQVTVYGQRPGSACGEWTFSVADMARFGIHHVQAPANYGHHPIALEGVDWCLLQLPPASGVDAPVRR